MNTQIETNANATNEMQSACQDINNVLTTANVSPMFQAHYTSMESGKHGIENLIVEILTAHNAVFHKGIENTENRKTAVATALFAADIIALVQAKFTAGTTRYPYATIHSYLSYFMASKKGNGKVASFKLSNAEDKNRECCKPRRKFYLVAA